MFTTTKVRKFISILFIVAIILSNVHAPGVSAQSRDGLKRQVNAQSGKVSFIGPETGRVVSASQALGTFLRPQDPALALVRRFATEFGIENPARDLTEMKKSKFGDGRITVRYQQSYEGIPVIGGELIVNTNENGDLYSVNGEVSPDLSLPVQPKIDSAQATQTALQEMAKWYEKSAEDFIASPPELWIFDESLFQPSTRSAELVWRMEVTPKDLSMPIRELVLVNAERGTISLHFNQVDTAWHSHQPQKTSEAVSVTPEAPPWDSQQRTTKQATEYMPTLAEGTWYVATNGNDASNCTDPSTPCATINAAIAKATSGDTIKVATGTYTGITNNVVIISKGLTLSGGWTNLFTLQDGASIIDGGGIRNGILATDAGSTVIVEYFVIQNSHTGLDSGGIYIYGANFTLRNSSVINNSGARGAGIFVTANATLTVLNSTISKNAASSGAGIYAVDGTVSINNSTIAYNNSTNAGGGLTNENGSVVIRNSILARNIAVASGPDCSGVIATSDHNILGNTSGCSVTAGTGDQLNIDPSIDSSLTGNLPLHALLANSPAINAGDNVTCLTIDQRSLSRPQGAACDIGAYELLVSKSLSPQNGSNQTARVSTAFAAPLMVFARDDQGEPASGVTITFTAPASGASGTFSDTNTNTSSAITDGNGYATSSTFTANNQPGGYSVQATAASYEVPAVFNLTNIFADLYVSTGGSDSNSCVSPSSPCLTINGAINKAVAGNTIAIASGTYTGTGTYVVMINKALTLSGGWNNSFSQQTGFSVIDGQNVRSGIQNNGINIVNTIDHFKVTNGFSQYSAGGISSYAPLIINNSIVIGNRSGGGSTGSVGGIYASRDLTLNNTTVQGNTNSMSSGPGGILISGSNTFTLNNSTITQNQAFSGGGIWLSGGSGAYPQITNIFNSTISNNRAQYGGGINIDGWSPSRTVTIKNSIIANNTATTNGPDCRGAINIMDYSNLGSTADCTVPFGSGNLLNIDPLISLYPIGILGYHSLQVGSPARDAGSNCLSMDQRGMSRPQGSACDMGAYEYTTPGPASSFGLAGGSNQQTPTEKVFPGPLAVYVVDSNGNPVSGLNVTYAAPASGASGIFAATGTNTTTIPTDSTGLAVTSAFTANTQIGTYHVTATVSGLPGSTDFVLTNSNFFVSPTGNDGNSCNSPAEPCLTINGAINKASNGDVIKVASGTYIGTGTQVVSINKNLTLLGGWDTTFSSQNGFSIIDGQSTRIGIYNSATNATVDRFIIQNGYTSSSGAGINSYQGSFTINKSLIINNRAVSGGGGIFSGGNLTLNNSTVRNNSSSYSGGGIAISLATNSLTLNNSTIANNQATSSGGGIVLYSSSSTTPGIITIHNSTLVYNQAGSSGGGFYNAGGSSRPVNITNSILANNTATTSGPDCQGVVNIFDHGLVSNTSNCTLANGAGNLFNIDPLVNAYPLGLLGYHALQQNSPAIDAGSNCLSWDQRGVSRPQGNGCDIGAYEYTAAGIAASFGIASGSNQRTGQLLPFSLPLAIYIVDGLGSPVSGVNVTFSAPASGPSGTFADNGTHVTTMATNSEGIAISPVFTANSELGTYNVVATAAGLAGSSNFVLTNANWFVAITGSDGNSCSSPAAPCLTINGAIGKAFSGDVIKVASGVYTGYSSTVVSITKKVTLSGGWDNSFSTQTGLSIIDGSFGAYDGITVSTADVSVSRFIVRNSRYGIYHSGGTFIFDQGALIDNKNGIYNYDGNTTFTNTTISGSHAGGTAGSAISNVRGTTRIQYSTITNNSGSYAIYSSNGYAYIKIANSILAGNSGGDCYIGSNPSVSEGYNIFGSSPACSGSGITLHPTDQVGKNPKLFSRLSGGYHPILPGSPALNAANPASCPSTDQRGVGRPFGAGCDIGAFEFRNNGVIPAYIIAVEGTPQIMVPGNQAITRLKAVILDPGGDGVPGITVTFTGPANGASVIFADTGMNSSSAITDANGVATSSIFSANDIGGAYIVTATTAGLAGTANFQLYNGTARAQTYTANNTASLPGSFLCDQNQPNCTNNINPHADAAHKYAIGTHNLYASKHQRDSINNAGMVIISTVHYSSGYQNAFWSGTQMVYGDAADFPLADDVVAHELTHGVMQYESNLFYYYQSGAINESFSDLWGEYYDQTNGQGNDAAEVKWLMGEDVLGLGALRSMSNPPTYGDPDKMSSSYYFLGQSDNGGVHTNSGVNNKAVYLMVAGDAFNGKTVTGLGWDKTAAIYYETNTNLLASGADYSDLYYALQQACTNLLGQKGITVEDCVQVKLAIDAVEMNGQPVPNFNTDTPLCAPDLTVNTIFFDGLETGTSNWSFTNGSYKRWQYDSPSGQYAHSGLHFLYADDYPQYSNNPTDAKATLRPIIIPNDAYLYFAHAYDFQTNGGYYYDGGVIEYSADNGYSWQDAGSLIDFNGYTGIIYTNRNNPLKGRPAFAASSHGYISTRLNLAPLAGQTVLFRWRMGLDDSGYLWGWWLDDVRIYRCGYTVSGNVGAAGATLSYMDGSLTNATSLPDGSYSIAVPSGWSGTITPSLSGVTFSPTSRTYNNVTSNQTGQDYSAWVTLSGNSGIAGTSLSYTDGTLKTVTADDSGNYSLTVPYGWLGTVTPSRTGFTFVPANKSYASLGTNQSNQNFMASWVGGVKVEADRNVVAVGRPHVDSEVTTYNSFTSGSLNAYVPMLFKDAFGGSYDSALYVQNVNATNTANITIKFYDASGVQTHVLNDTLAPFASKGYWLPGISALGSSWVGGVKVESDQNIVAVGRPHVGSEVLTYNGFSAGSLTAYVPMLFKDAFGGSYDAALYIQNVDPSNTANLTIKFYDASGVLTHSLTDTLSPLASKGYWMPGIGALGTSWVGGVKIESDQNIVAVGRPHIGTQVLAYDGFPAGSRNTYTSMLFKDAFGGSYDSALYIQNVDAANTANFTLKFYDGNGNLTCSQNDTILPLASKGYWLPGIACLGTSWVGGVKVESNVDIVTVGRPHIGTQIMAYDGFSTGSLNAYVPMLFRDGFEGSYDSALYLQNLDAGNTADVTIKLYDASGNLACTLTDTLSALASKGYWLPGLVCPP